MAGLAQSGRAFDCRAGGRGFDSRGRTITQSLKITEKWRYFLCTASGETFAWLGWPRKMAVPSPLEDVKYSVPNEHFRAKYIDTQIKKKCIKVRTWNINSLVELTESWKEWTFIGYVDAIQDIFSWRHGMLSVRFSMSTYPIWTLHFRDRHGAASLRHRKLRRH